MVYIEDSIKNQCAFVISPAQREAMDLSDFTEEDFASMTQDDWDYVDRCNAELMVS